MEGHDLAALHAVMSASNEELGQLLGERAASMFEQATALANAAQALGVSVAVPENAPRVGAQSSPTWEEFRASQQRVHELESEAIPDALRVSFAPDAIRQHFEGENDLVAVAVQNADDDALTLVGEGAVASDSVWKLFHEVLSEQVREQLITQVPDKPERRNGELTLAMVRDAGIEFGRPFSLKELVEKLGWSRGTVASRLHELVEKGTFKREGGERGPGITFEHVKPEGGGPSSRPHTPAP